MTDYDKKAQDFLEKTNTCISKKFIKYGLYFNTDKEKRNIREITLSNQYHTYTFTYGDSIIDSSNYFVSDDVNLHRKIKSSSIFFKLMLKDYQEVIDIANKMNNARNRKYKNMLNIKDDKKDFDIVNRERPHNRRHIERLPELLIEIAPSDYSILSSLTPMYEDSHEDFCSSYGYDVDSIQGKKIYEDCLIQDGAMRKLRNRDEIEELSEIQ